MVTIDNNNNREKPTKWKQGHAKGLSGKRLVLSIALRVPLWIIWLVSGILVVRTISPLPAFPQEQKTTAIKHLFGLREAVRSRDAPRKMQELFPEGACFTITLYALSWTNLLDNYDVDEELRRMAIAETKWALEQYEQPYLVYPFEATQVRNGVFWLGQRNLALGQLLEIVPEGQRPPHLVDEFHRNSESLAEAFLASPTAHLDSYPGLCWPADNVTALASLLLHDRLYSTNYRTAYEYWRDWTEDYCDPQTGLPAGHLNSRTGQLLQPARGCATSWILALLPEMDRGWAADLYGLYQKHFLVTRLGFRGFREYPEGFKRRSDVDSGPILLDAGATATVVGLAASFANNDAKTAEDINSLANALGWRNEIDLGGISGIQYMFGRIPAADAFLTWAFTLPIPESHFSLWARRVPIAVLILLSVVSIWQVYKTAVLVRYWRKRMVCEKF